MPKGWLWPGMWCAVQARQVGLQRVPPVLLDEGPASARVEAAGAGERAVPAAQDEVAVEVGTGDAVIGATVLFGT